MCVQAHCMSNWFFGIDPVQAWQWIGPHGSGRSGVDMINTVIYPENTGQRNHPQFDQVYQQVTRARPVIAGTRSCLLGAYAGTPMSSRFVRTL